MGKRTFRGGVHPNGNKGLSKDKASVAYLPKGDVVIPLGMHIGKPASPVVAKGDTVLAGQLIAEASGFISANIVSSISGKVKAIEPRMTGAGVLAPCVVIENDGQFTLAEGIGEPCNYEELSNKEIIDKIKAAGVVGLGGAGFPTHVKMMPQNPEEIDYIIVNGAECEPYITCDDRLMQEHPEQIVGGLQVILKLFPQAKGIVAIEDNKPAAIETMTKAAEGISNIEVWAMKTKYPQGGERNLVYAVTGRRLAGGQLPAALGCIVDNVATVAAIYKAVCLNTPLMEKGFTVTGDAVAEPSNFIVKIGTVLDELVEATGGFVGDPEKLLLGGPMMGLAISGTDVPVQKANNALTCMLVDEVKAAEEIQTQCIRCGRCVRACPVGLYPQLMAEAAEKKDYARYEKVYGLDCMQCGSCTYVCPAKRPLIQLFKVTKGEILARRAAAKAKEAK